MNLKGERLIPATPETTWAALNDPETLKACIAGCESLERVGDDEYLSTVALRIGPVNARFKGRLKLQNIVPISSYTIAFDGQGGVAGFGKGSADVRLAPDAGGTRLGYEARAQVGGKLAQVGSRLIEGAAAKVANDFFTAFESHVAAAGVSPGAAPPPAGEASPAGIPSPAGERTSAAPAPAPASRWLPWVVAALVILVLLWYWLR